MSVVRRGEVPRLVTVVAAVITLGGGAAGAQDAVAPPAPAPAVTAHVDAAPAPRGLAVGIEVGEPTSLTVGYWAGALGIRAAVGSGTRAGLGIAARVEGQLEVTRLAAHVPLHVGLGARLYRHGYEEMSLDEIPDTHVGLRASVAIGYERGGMLLYAEAAPGVDVVRTTSCSLASGPYSLCPHAQASPLFLQLVVGARWFLSR